LAELLRRTKPLKEKRPPPRLLVKLRKLFRRKPRKVAGADADAGAGVDAGAIVRVDVGTGTAVVGLDDSDAIAAVIAAKADVDGDAATSERVLPNVTTPEDVTVGGVTPEEIEVIKEEVKNYDNNNG
jgi:hypothetical protein